MRCWIPSGKAISIFKGYLQQEVDYLQYGANRPNDGEKKKKKKNLLLYWGSPSLVSGSRRVRGGIWTDRAVDLWRGAVGSLPRPGRHGVLDRLILSQEPQSRFLGREVKTSRAFQSF